MQGTVHADAGFLRSSLATSVAARRQIRNNESNCQSRIHAHDVRSCLRGLDGRLQCVGKTFVSLKHGSCGADTGTLFPTLAL